jgi:hypothetical protein
MNKMDKAINELDACAGHWLIHISVLARVSKKYRLNQIKLWRAFVRFATDKYDNNDACPCCGREE